MMGLTEVDAWPSRRCSFARWNKTRWSSWRICGRRVAQALRQRAQILLASLVYTPVYQIALICHTNEAHVRRVIHAFNEQSDM